MPPKGWKMSDEHKVRIKAALRATYAPAVAYSVKKCSMCGELKTASEFGRRYGERSHLLRSECRPCGAQRTRDFHQRRPDVMRNSNRRGSFRRRGLTESDYNEMLSAQGGCCAICGDPPKQRRLAVDHCHSTGENRALLCDLCNKALGGFRDNPEIMIKAAKYVTAWHVGHAGEVRR